MPSALEADRPRFRPVQCAACGEPLKRVCVVYGYPSPELSERAERGEVVLGGCVVVAGQRSIPHGVRRRG